MTLAVAGVSYAHGRTPALHDVSLRFQRGRVTAILGANGAGKSTLLRVLAGLIVPREGQVMIDGEPLSALDARTRARRIGYLPQSGDGEWRLVARDLVALGRLPHRSRFAGPTEADRRAIDAALAATDTAALADRTIDAMSGGERARVLFARMLAGEPEWLLADEPLADLDPKHQQRMLRLLRETAATGAGVVAIVHDLPAATRVADDVVLLADGCVIAAGPAAATLRPEALRRTYGIDFNCRRDGDVLAIVPLP